MLNLGSIGIYSPNFRCIILARARYWKITSEEAGKFSYDPNKLINWEIKCIREPLEEAHFIGVFLYRNGTPFDYTPTKGIVYFHNNINRKELPEITKFLKSKFGGEEAEKGERIFLKNSKEIYSSQEIASLAKDLEGRFNAKAIISLEFENLTKDEMAAAGLPDSKLLPIPGK